MVQQGSPPGKTRSVVGLSVEMREQQSGGEGEAESLPRKQTYTENSKNRFDHTMVGKQFRAGSGGKEQRGKEMDEQKSGKEQECRSLASQKGILL